MSMRYNVSVIVEATGDRESTCISVEDVGIDFRDRDAATVFAGALADLVPAILPEYAADRQGVLI